MHVLSAYRCQWYRNRFVLKPLLISIVRQHAYSSMILRFQSLVSHTPTITSRMFRFQKIVSRTPTNTRWHSLCVRISSQQEQRRRLTCTSSLIILIQLTPFPANAASDQVMLLFIDWYQNVGSAAVCFAAIALVSSSVHRWYRSVALGVAAFGLEALRQHTPIYRFVPV